MHILGLHLPHPKDKSLNLCGTHKSWWDGFIQKTFRDDVVAFTRKELMENKDYIGFMLCHKCFVLVCSRKPLKATNPPY